MFGFNPRKQQRKDKILAAITYISVLFFFFCFVSELVFNWPGLNGLADFFTLPVNVLFMAKLSVLARKRKELIEIVTIINDKFWPINKFGDQFEKYNKEMFNYTTLLIKRYLFIICISPVIYMTRHYPTKRNQLFFPIYTLCELQTFGCYLFYLIYQLIYCCIHQSPIMVCFDLIFIHMVSHGYIAIEMLKEGFLHLKLKGIDVEYPIELSDLIEQHRNVLRYKFSILSSVLRYMELLRTTFKAFFFIELFIAGASITLVFNLLTTNPFSVVFFGEYIYLFCAITLQIFIFSLGSSVLYHQMVSISNAAFACNWWAEPEIRKYLMIIIQRTQLEKGLSAGGVFDMDLSIFLSVMKTSFSICTLLTEVGGDK